LNPILTLKIGRSYMSNDPSKKELLQLVNMKEEDISSNGTHRMVLEAGNRMRKRM